MKNYYEILQVDRKASSEVIKCVYKMHIKKKHPDLYQGDEKRFAEEELKELNEAYEVLSDSQRRNEYDLSLEENEQIDKELFDDILQENARLKELLYGRKQDNITEEIKTSEIRTNESNYVPDPYITEQNNTKYLMKLIWKERLLRLIIFLTVFFAIVVGMYKATGVNIIATMLETLVKVFRH